MRALTLFQTADGLLHVDSATAKRHAEKVYGEALTKIAARLVVIDKYAAMCEAIEANIDEICRLSALKMDSVMQPEADDE